MLDWYQSWTLLVFLLWAFATPQDRNALRIVLIASLSSEVIVDFITRQIHAPWKLVIPGAVEILTILAMFQWAKGRTGHLQIGCLCAAWLAHLLCYVDVCLKTDLVYSKYETIIQIVAVGQILACYDTLVSIGRRVVEVATRLWGHRSLGLSAASNGAHLQRDKSH